MRLTKHAAARWAERFPHLDPEMEWTKCRRVGKKLRARIREQCPAHAWQTRGVFKGFYLRLSLNGVVFVVAAPDTVVTVFQLDDPNRQHYIRAEFGVQHKAPAQGRP